jgi:glycosyltransferase involved in cell wall biosynthesis
VEYKTTVLSSKLIDLSNQYNQTHDVEGVVFACVYIRRSLMNKVGYLDEDYFSYFEDTDYCLKALEAGFRVINCGDLTIYHREHGSTEANNLEPNALFIKSQKTFLDKWKGYLDSRLDMGVGWHSTFTRPVGYAMSSRQLALALEDARVHVGYRYLYGHGTVFPLPEDASVNTGSYRIEVIKRREINPQDPQIIYGQGDAFGSVEGNYRVGYTMLETTGIPNEWVRQCNEMNEVWVPSPFNAWSFRRSGVNVPIKVMPLGLIDTQYFNPGIRGYRTEDDFSFLSVFEWGERKAPETLLRAFNRAFRAHEPVVLICKYSNHDPGLSPSHLIEQLNLDPEGGRILFSENDYVPYYPISHLYRSVDCFVLPTRGEGWGMPILEAMACGLPVIASYWSAQQYFMTDTNSYPLQARLVKAEAKCPYYAGFKWVEPDEEHLRHLLRHIFENQEEAKAKGQRAAKDVAERWSISQTARRMRHRLEEIALERKEDPIDAERIKPVSSPLSAMSKRIGVDVSRASCGEITGVGRYAVSLIQGLSELAAEENPFDYLLLPGFGGFTHPEYSPACQDHWPRDARFTRYRGPLPAFVDDDHYVSGLDLVYCTANTLPKALDMTVAMIVHDLTFVSHPQFHTEENIQLCKTSFERALESDCHFVANSESTRADFLNYYGVDSSRISLAYCGVDPHAFSPKNRIAVASVRQKYALPERYFLCVGSLEPRKNLESLVRAMALYRGRESLVVVGAIGWGNSTLHELLGQHQDKVQFLGYVPQGDLPALYTAAQATLYPSIYEGFGYPVVESMACGTPVLTSNNSSLREIGQGAALLIDDPQDHSALVEGMQVLSEDSQVYNELVSKGYERAREYTPINCARSTVRVFSDLLDQT